MDSSEARLDTIESQRLMVVDVSSDDQQKRRYFSINLIKRGILHTLRSLGFLQAAGESTPPMGDTESVPDFFTNIKFSDFLSFPGVYLPMNPEIFSAVSAGQKDWLEILRSYGKPMACLKSDQGDSVLHLAAAWGHLELVKSIVSECPCLLLELDSRDQLPLHLAARAGHVAVVEALVATVTFVSARMSEEERESLNQYVVKDKDGNTALHVAMDFSLKSAACLVKADHQASFLANKGRRSPLHMAIEIGSVSTVKAMLKATENDGFEGRRSNIDSQLEGRKDLVHVALKAKSTDVLDVILKEYPSLEDERDEEGMTCLSYGASIGFYEGVCNLLDRSTKSVYVCNNDGSFPIHIAVEKYHMEVVEEIINRCPDSIHLLNKQGQNIIHINVSERGKAGLILFYSIFKPDCLRQMMEKQDVDGNTPLHLATINWRPRTIFRLCTECPTAIDTFNNEGLTPLDIAEKNLHPNYIYMERVTLMVSLLCRGRKMTKQSDPHSGDKIKDYVNSLLVVAALVATMTFAAGFTLPGGFISSGQKLGSATLATDRKLIFFIVFDILAMQSSTLTIATLIWAQLGDPALVHRSLKVALPSLFFSLLCMPVAFYCGVLIAFAHVKGVVFFLNITFFLFFFKMLFSLTPHVILQIPGISFTVGKYLMLFVMLLNDDSDEQTYDDMRHSYRICETR